MKRRTLLQHAAVGWSTKALGQTAALVAGDILRAGVATVAVTPALGSSLAGNFTDIRSTENHDELQVKCLMLERGAVRIALLLCDVCVIPAALVDRVRGMAERRCGLPRESVLIAATHTHSAATTMPVFQSKPDPGYVDWLAIRMADCVSLAAARLEPAKLGYAFGEERTLSFNRRYYMKPGSVLQNPFGGFDRVRMNPGIGNADIVKPAGPTDPRVGVLAVQSVTGRPMAVVGNYSLHYVGGQPRGHVSADYFAYWASAVTRELGVRKNLDSAPFAAMLFNGAQGDINNIDVSAKPGRREPYQQMLEVAEKLAVETVRVLKGIHFDPKPALGARSEALEIEVRLPSDAELDRARGILSGIDPDSQVTSLPQVYARETVYLAAYSPATERAGVQSIRIGELGITAFSGEPFVEMGLALRAQRTFDSQFVIGLSNGHVGYVPTERAFEEGGYETWRAKTSHLHPSAADRMTATALRQLGGLRG